MCVCLCLNTSVDMLNSRLRVLRRRVLLLIAYVLDAMTADDTGFRIAASFGADVVSAC